MTGTPLDLTPFGPLLKGLGHLYWVVALAILLLALWWPKRWWLKLTSATIVAATVVYPVFVRPIEKHVEAANEEQLQFKERLNAAAAHFEMRCKSAGEKITRTVENVEGVVWMKWRPKYIDEQAQFKLEDPFGHDCGETGCIERLLRVTRGLELDPEKKQPRQIGYRFVESIDPADGKAYRYTLGLYRTRDRDARYGPSDISTELLKQPIERPSARYGITWDDISTRDDRERWIAGGAIKVIDLQTNEVIAQRTGYMLDRGQGGHQNGPTAWLMARRHACPPFPGGLGQRSWPNTETLTFAIKVLTP